MDCSPPGSSVHEIFQARVLEWVVMPSSRGSSQPRDRTLVSCIAGRFFTVWVTREAHAWDGWLSKKSLDSCIKKKDQNDIVLEATCKRTPHAYFCKLCGHRAPRSLSPGEVDSPWSENMGSFSCVLPVVCKAPERGQHSQTRGKHRVVPRLPPPQPRRGLSVHCLHPRGNLERAGKYSTQIKDNWTRSES